MFGIFRRSKAKETSDFVRWIIFNEVMRDDNLRSDVVNITNGSTEVVKGWLGSLPRTAIDGCQPAMLAAYVLVGDSIVQSKTPGSEKLVDLYLTAAQQLVGIAFKSRAGILSQAELAKLPEVISQGEVSTEEFQLVSLMARIAKESGLTFNEEIEQIVGV